MTILSSGRPLAAALKLLGGDVAVRHAGGGRLGVVGR